MYIQVHCTHTEHVYVQPICCSPVKYCTCNHATLFSSATVQLCNCSTVQLFNCPTCRALSGMESKSYDFRCCRDVVNASPASVASLAFSAASASAARNLCRRHRMNVGYHCSPDCLANILRLSSPIARREKHKNNKKQKGENGKISKSQRQSEAKARAHLEFLWLTRWLVRHSNAWINKRHSEIQIPGNGDRDRDRDIGRKKSRSGLYWSCLVQSGPLRAGDQQTTK